MTGDGLSTGTITIQTGGIRSQDDLRMSKTVEGRIGMGRLIKMRSRDDRRRSREARKRLEGRDGGDDEKAGNGASGFTSISGEFSLLHKKTGESH